MVRKISFKGIPIIPEKFADLITWHRSHSLEVQSHWEESRERYLETHLFTRSEAKQLRFIPKGHTALKVIVILRRNIVASLMREHFEPRKAVLYKSYKAKARAQPSMQNVFRDEYSRQVGTLEERYVDMIVRTVAELRRSAWGVEYGTYIDEVYPIIIGSDTLEDVISDFFDTTHINSRLSRYAREEGL